MKNALLAAAASLFIHVTTSFAGTYSDDNPANVWLNALHPSYTGTFDIASDGYDSTAETVLSAYAEFLFFDLVLNESLTVTVGGENFASHGSFFMFLTIGDDVLGSALLDLDADGILSYTITRASGEFWLKHASLTAITGPRTSQPVPEAGTSVVLLGLGLLGVGLARGKRHLMV